jgi:hypothetical protein
MYDDKSFTALDKLIDFTNGQTIQEQMIQSMNNVIANMRIPDVDNSMHKAKSREEKNSDEN